MPHSTETPSSTDAGLRWYQGISRYAWIVLIIASLGWMFDTLDQNLFNAIRQKSVLDLLRNSGLEGQELSNAADALGGNLTAIFLIGWAAGGFIFGILGDKLGRVRTMVIAILTYALFTGLNSLVQTPWQYGLCRFLTALGVGGEFAAGASLVAEVWPQRSRPMALGTLQALSAVGNIGAALIAMALHAVSWRWVFAIGVFPALLVVWVRMSIREPEAWTRAKEKALTEGVSKELGNITDLFRLPDLRRNTIAGVLIALAGVGGLWGVFFFLPDLVGKVLTPIVERLPEVRALSADEQVTRVKDIVQFHRARAFLLLQVGALFGMFSFAPVSERTGRRPAMFFFICLALVSVQLVFWGVRDIPSAYMWALLAGFAGLAPFSAFAVYFPELYPTRLRATGVGVCYNAARILAAVAPFALGQMASNWISPSDPAYGFRVSASIVSVVYLFGLIGVFIAPETRGKPLPE